MNHGQARQRFYNSFPLTTQPRSIRVIDIIGELPIVTSSEAGPVNEAGNKLRMGGEEPMHPSPTVRMRVINLDDKPAFTALSYVWGDSDDTSHAFEIAGGELPVTKNCWAALSQLRKNFGPLTIWVDSLCIDQYDDDEKLSQIGLMGDIYSSAAYVYFWLGESNPASQKAMAYLRTCGLQDRLDLAKEMTYQVPYQQSNRYRLLFWHCFRNPWILCHERDVQNTFAPMETLDDILSRPWIQRIWTLQEAMFAKRPIICCGSQILSWRSLTHAICYLHHVETFFLGEKLGSSLAPWKTLVLLWFRFNSGHTSTRDDHPHVLETPFDCLLPHYCRLLRDVLKLHRCLHMLTVLFVPFYTYLVLLTILLSVGITYSKALPAENETGDDDEGSETGWLVFATVVAVLLFIAMNAMLADAALGSDVPQRSRDEINRAHRRGIEAVLHEMCRRQATDPKDKYHGMRSLLAQLEVPEVPASLGTVEDVHRELFQALYARTKSLGLLLCCGNGDVPYGYSWVPRWNVDFTAGWFDPKHVLGLSNTALPVPGINFRGRGQLILTATIHSTVVEVSGLLSQEDDERNPRAMKGRLPIREGKYLHGLELIGGSLLLYEPACKAMVEYRRQFLRVKANEEEKVGNGPEQARVGDSIALVPGFSLPLILRRKASGYTFEFIGIAELHVTAEDFQKDLQEIVIE